MVRYSAQPEDPEKSCKVRGNNLKVHYKNTRETVQAIRKKTITEAIRYLNDVIEHKDIVPFRRHNGGVGRHAQAKKYKTSQGRWPQKSCKIIKNLLSQLTDNGHKINLSPDALVISHAQVNRAAKRRRRTYRAHGRINPYMGNPCHIELMASIKPEPVAAGEGKKAAPKKNLKSGDTA
ncbi:60S ribosomal protein L17 [Bonamia ostreae]|uniref:60S ribosomal protein L17 n=1 Tax=Bonamia ostreae TaxID=126728 RepID=A0ABV2AJD0_9EUKA